MNINIKNNKYKIYKNTNLYNNILLLFDKINKNYLYILYCNNKIITYFYILNYIYILFINNINIILYIIPNMYIYIYKNLYNKLNTLKLYILKLSVIGINYKCYYLNNYNILILQLKYNHKLIIKLPKIIICTLLNKYMISLSSYNLYLLTMISNLIQLLQYPIKYKNIGIYVDKN